MEGRRGGGKGYRGNERAREMEGRGGDTGHPKSRHR